MGLLEESHVNTRVSEIFRRILSSRKTCNGRGGGLVYHPAAGYEKIDEQGPSFKDFPKLRLAVYRRA